MKRIEKVKGSKTCREMQCVSLHFVIHNHCLLLISSTAIATVALTLALIASWTYSVTSVASVLSNVSIDTTPVALDFVFVISRMSLTCSSDSQQK